MASSDDDDDKTPPLGAPSIPPTPTRRSAPAPAAPASRKRVAPIPPKASTDARALSSRVRAPSPPPVEAERTRIEAAPVGMEFAEEEPLTMLDARVAIGLPIERQDGQKPLSIPVRPVSASAPSSPPSKPSTTSSSDRARSADPGLLAKIGQRAPDAFEDKTPPSSAPAVVMPRVSAVDPASTPARPLNSPASGAAAKLTEAAKARASRFRRPKIEPGDSTPGWLDAIALREYLLFSALILTFIAASFFTRKEKEVPIVRLRAAEKQIERPKPWQQALRETPIAAPPPEHVDPTPHLEPPPTPVEPEPEPAPPETSKAGAGRRLSMRFFTVHSKPPGASVSINGSYRGKTPFIESSMKDLSKADVEVSMDGYKSWTGSVEPNPAGHITVSARLERGE